MVLGLLLVYSILIFDTDYKVIPNVHDQTKGLQKTGHYTLFCKKDCHRELR